jgi:histone H3/H4
MDWDDEAKELMKKVPEGIMEMAVGNAEEFAREKGYKQVTKKSIDELMESLGMNMDDML